MDDLEKAYEDWKDERERKLVRQDLDADSYRKYCANYNAKTLIAWDKMFGGTDD